MVRGGFRIVIQKGLKSNNNKIIIIISIIAVLLILLLIFFIQKNVNENDDNSESINSESSENSENIENSDKSDNSDNSVINDNSKDNVSVSTTAPTTIVEEIIGNNPGFEEEESLDENDSNSGSTAAKDPENSANQSGDPSTAETEHSTINEDPTDAEQDPTENETTGLPPKAPSQAGEWGNPIKN